MWSVLKKSLTQQRQFWKRYFTKRTIFKKVISHQGQSVSALSSLWIQSTGQQKLIWQVSRYICKCIFWKCVFRKKKVSTEVGEYTQTWNSIFNDLHGTRPFAWLYALSIDTHYANGRVHLNYKGETGWRIVKLLPYC